MRPTTIQRCSRFHTLGLLLLNHATFPPPEQQQQPSFFTRIPGVRLARDMWALQCRLHVNHVMVATRGRAVVGSVEIHSPEYLRSRGGTFTDEQAAKLQPYLCSMAVRESERGRGLGRMLVEAVVQEAATTAPPGQWLLLQVEANNEPALKLYETCGFRRLSDARCQIHLMRRRLGAEPPSPSPPAAPPTTTARASWLDG